MLASPAARGKVPQNRVRVDQYVRDRIIMCRGVAPCAACQRAHFGHHLQQRVGHLSETAADGRSECVCGCLGFLVPEILNQRTLNEMEENRELDLGQGAWQDGISGSASYCQG